MAKNAERKAIDKVFILLGSAATLTLVIVGALAWYGYSFATGMVSDQLAAQKIYFPAKDSEAFVALPAADQKAILPHAGKQLVTGDQARVYADNYIGAHLKGIAGGKTYSEISSESMKNPDDKELAGKKAALFQGETLRGILLGTGYAFWTFGLIAKYVAIAAFGGAIAMAVLVLLGKGHLARIK